MPRAGNQRREQGGGDGQESAALVAAIATADAGFIRRARAGRQDNAVGFHGQPIGWSDLVIPLNDDFGPKLSQIVEQVVSETVIVIDQKKQNAPVILSIQSKSTAKCRVLGPFDLSTMAGLPLGRALGGTKRGFSGNPWGTWLSDAPTVKRHLFGAVDENPRSLNVERTQTPELQ